MASITHDGRAYRARYRGPDGRLREHRFARKIDARRWLDEQTSQHVTGTYVDPALGRVTVGDWSQRWLDSKGNLKASTRDRYASILATHVRPVWDAVRLTDVTHDQVQAWTAGLTASGLSAASVVKAHRVLSMVLAYAVRSRRLASNPADGVTLPRVTRADRRYLRADQVAALADAAGPGRLVVLTLAYTGLRWGELAALRVSRVDLLRRRLHVAESVTEVDGGRLDWGLPKSHERRWVPLPRILADDLAVQLAGKAPEELAFTTRHGAVLRVGGARRSWWDRAAAAAGVPGLTPHELRHTAASLAVSAGANVKAVQAMLGHAKASMTLDVYADLFDDDLEAVGERLDAVARAASVGKVWATGTMADLDGHRTGR
jgi:integrase